MITAVVISSLVVTLVAILMLTRIVFCIDTRNRVFYASVGRIFRFDLEWTGFIPQPVIRALWWTWQPRLWGSTEKRQPGKKQKKETERGQFSARRLRSVVALLGSFHLKRLKLDLDTGDYVLNAQLYPLNHIVRNERVCININWQNENHLLLVLESRVIRMVYHMMK